MTLRILVEPSDYILRNAGDTAMLRVAVTRLGALWPDAHITVFSDLPDRFPAWTANASPLNSKARSDWLRTPFLTRHLPPGSPAALERTLARAQDRLRRERPALARRLLRASLWRRGEDAAGIDAFYEAVDGADLVLATGMGGITDVFPEYADELLDVLGLAQTRGALTVLVGQGMGPLDEPSRRARASEVLRRADLVALRERRAGVPLLRELGVSEERVTTTGDDAIELARDARPARLGGALGINVRGADYAGVSDRAMERIRAAIEVLSQELGAPLVSVPISSVPGEEDAITVSRLIGEGLGDERPADEGLFERIGRCRTVIAGSYHAAVFALSMGIPAIGLHGSPYYRDKFLGLADMFGAGCWALSLDDPDFEPALVDTTRTAWRGAEALRPELLRAAESQIAAGHAAYERVRALVEARRGGLSAR